MKTQQVKHYRKSYCHFFVRLFLISQKWETSAMDGAGNMSSGNMKGASPRIQWQYPKAIPFWCVAHQCSASEKHDAYCRSSCSLLWIFTSKTKEARTSNRRKLTSKIKSSRDFARQEGWNFSMSQTNWLIFCQQLLIHLQFTQKYQTLERLEQQMPYHCFTQSVILNLLFVWLL